MQIIESFSLQPGYSLQWIPQLQTVIEFCLFQILLVSGLDIRRNLKSVRGLHVSFIQSGTIFANHAIKPENKKEETGKSIFDNYLELLKNNKISGFDQARSDGADG